MHRLLNILYNGFMVGVGLGTVFQLALLPLIGMRAYEEWTGLLVWGFAISVVTGVVSALSFWFMNSMMVRQGK
jgi:heme/copper-type cytochrome/quinol oxidase subunit 2